MSRPAPLAPLAADVPARPERTVADWIPVFLGWFQAVRGRADNTIVNYHRDLTTFARFLERCGVRDPRRVTFQHIEAFMAHRTRHEGVKARTANRERYAIGALYKFLRRQGVVGHDPAADVFALREPERLPNWLTIPEQERVLAHFASLRSLTGRRDYALIATGLFCGLRAEELVTARLANLDLESRRLRIVGKGNREREAVIVPRLAAILGPYVEEVRPKLLTQPSGGSVYRDPRTGIWYAKWRVRGERIYRSTGTDDEAEARAVLADWLAEARVMVASPYLFVRRCERRDRPGSPLLTRSLYAMIAGKVSAIVGRPVSPHVLRHSFASRLRMRGAPLELIQEALGHRNIKTTLQYAHITPEKRREDLARYLEGPEGGA